MPLHDKKIISIILEQCNGVEERFNGYREELIEVISDILIYERRHLVSFTNIQQKVNDKCNAAAGFLVEQRSRKPLTKDLRQ